jgi:hypothetical protein
MLSQDLLSSASYQTLHNAFVVLQQEREKRLRDNLDKLEALNATRSQQNNPP